MKKRGHPEEVRPEKCKRKSLLAMKLTVCLMLCLQFNLWASVSAQTKVSLDLKGVTMDEFIAEMGKQTGKEFFFHSDLLEKPVKLDVNASEEEYTSILDRVLPQAKLTYEVINDVVVIKRLPQLPQEVKKRIVRGTVKDENGDPVPGGDCSQRCRALFVGASRVGEVCIGKCCGHGEPDYYVGGREGGV